MGGLEQEMPGRRAPQKKCGVFVENRLAVREQGLRSAHFRRRPGPGLRPGLVSSSVRAAQVLVRRSWQHLSAFDETGSLACREPHRLVPRPERVPHGWGFPSVGRAALVTQERDGFRSHRPAPHRGRCVPRPPQPLFLEEKLTIPNPFITRSCWQATIAGENGKRCFLLMVTYFDFYLLFMAGVSVFQLQES